MKSNTSPSEQLPITNCHVHTFTGDYVPPWLAKTFMPWPLYYLLSTTLLVRLCRWYYKHLHGIRYTDRYAAMSKLWYHASMMVQRYRLLNVVRILLGGWLTLHVFFILWNWIRLILHPAQSIETYAGELSKWLSEHGLLFSFESVGLQIGLVLLLLLLFPSGVNLIFFVLKRVFKIFSAMPGRHTKELLGRYWNIGRFAFHTQQEQVFLRLMRQYPAGSQFIILPMDMEYMGAGKPAKQYAQQLAELAIMKDKHPNVALPFIFADPRRMATQSDYFKFKVNSGKVELLDCVVKTYLEEKQFSGIKLYPALGYFPFDEELLPLYKYAADHQIPVLTHCIRGTIYYRGTKEKAWDYHPIFKYSIFKEYQPMLLPEKKNMDFCNNFTHPLNYLCLLNPTLLAVVVGQAKKQSTKDLFGYDEKTKTIQYNLEALKLCFGHFGGDDEWKRYTELDRDNYGSKVVQYPDWGIEMVSGNTIKHDRLEHIWKYADWYSIICSLMLQHPNVYADISYILHEASIQPLLKQTLANHKLRERTLFGTDFYVVRNHNSDKGLLAELKDQLSDEEFDQIARVNPGAFLKRGGLGGIG